SILNNEKILQKRFIKLRSALRSNENHKFGKLVPNQIISMYKSCNLEDTKRKWFNNFSRTEEQNSIPIHL
ncbi:MAG: hypothetical protein ACOCRK_10025, partial [bacterium]